MTTDTGKSASPIQPTEQATSSDSIVRWFAGTTVIWGALASLSGMFVAYFMLQPETHRSFGDLGVFLSYGRIRPVFATIAVYAFAGNAAFTAIYFSMQRLCKTRMWSSTLSWMHYLGWQIVVLASIVTIPMGMTQGKELGEAQWPIDMGFAVVWVLFFGVNFMMTIINRREKQLYVSMWFYIVTVVSVGVYQIAHVLLTDGASWQSQSILSGARDAVFHSVFLNNTVLILLTLPFLGLIYYFAPKASRRPIYSYKLAIVQFWGMVLCFFWVGPARLHLAAIPDWVSSLAMIFGLMLLMPIWGGVVNGLRTLMGDQSNVPTQDAEQKNLNDFVVKFLTFGVVMLGVTSLLAAAVSIKSVSAVLNYTHWSMAQMDAVVFGCCGMLAIGMIYYLVPKLFQCQPFNESLVGLHFWISVAGVCLTVIAGYTAGLWQGLSQSALTRDTGQLENLEFLASLNQVSMLLWLRLIGLGLLSLGMILMAANYLATALSKLGKCNPCKLASDLITDQEIQRPASRFADTPMLEVAKNLDVWRHFDWHRAWERDAGKFVVLPLVVMGVATVFQLTPALLFPSGAAPIASVQPYSPLELAGREIFVQEGCVNCHTQMVRSLVAETKRYGDFSQGGEFEFDHPSQWGHRRIGPDLAREGGKKTSHWHWMHLQDPRDELWCEPTSVMPSFAHLSTEELDFDRLMQQVATAKRLGADYAIADEDLADVARTQAEQIAADVVGGGGPIWTLRNNKQPLMVYDSKAIALIAYIQRLGVDLFKPPPTAGQTASK